MLPSTFAPDTSKQSLLTLLHFILLKFNLPKSISIASAKVSEITKLLIVVLEEIIFIASSLFELNIFASEILTFESIILTPPYRILDFSLGNDKFLKITFLIIKLLFLSIIDPTPISPFIIIGLLLVPLKETCPSDKNITSFLKSIFTPSLIINVLSLGKKTSDQLLYC